MRQGIDAGFIFIAQFLSVFTPQTAFCLLTHLLCDSVFQNMTSNG